MMRFFFVALCIALLNVTLLFSHSAKAAEDDVWEEIEAEELSDTQLPSGTEGGWETLPSPSQAGRIPMPEPARDDGMGGKVKTPTMHLPSNVGRTDFPSADERDYAMFTESADSRYDARSVINVRPRFSLWLGPQWRSFASTFVEENTFGKEVGISYRLIDAPFGKATGLSIMAAMSFHDLETFINKDSNGRVVRAVQNVKDTTLRIGPMAEIGLTSRLQGIVGFIYRDNQIRADTPQSEFLELAGLKQRGFYLGLGANYDFYKIPYGRFGLKVYVQPASVIGCVVFCDDSAQILADSEFDDTTAETLYTVAVSLSLGVPPKQRPIQKFDFYDQGKYGQ